MTGIEALFGLPGRTAVVTGASSGLGDRFARVLHDAGATVVVTARRGDRLQQLARELGDRVVPVVADLTVVADRERVIATAIDATGRVDVLVNNAGIGDPAAAATETLERFEQMLEHGLVDEVRTLRARPDLHLDLPSMRCVGYRQVWEELDWQERRDKPALNMHLVREKGIAATRQLAKRQITWLRSMPQRQTIACDAPQEQATLVARALAVCRAI